MEEVSSLAAVVVADDDSSSSSIRCGRPNNNNNKEGLKKKKAPHKTTTSGIAIAMHDAQTLFFKRDPLYMASIPLTEFSKQTVKRHCIRYVNSDGINMDPKKIANLECSFLVPLSYNHYTPSEINNNNYCHNHNDNNNNDKKKQPNPPPKVLLQQLEKNYVQCTIVDYAYYNNEWWIYLNSLKPIKTFLVCKYIHQVCKLENGFFFTDEIPGGRKSIKRYDFTKLQHFKRCLYDIKCLVVSQGH